MSEGIQEGVAPEWSYPMLSDEIGTKVQRVKLDANDDQRVALARRLGVNDISSAHAEVEIKRISGNMTVYVSGVVEAQVEQECVVTLDPIYTQVKEEFEAWYADPGQAVSFVKARQQMMADKAGEEAPILDEKDDPEPIVGGVLDLGELATQYLSLAIDPYPHAEGVHYEIGDDDPKNDPSKIRENPFAKLKDWKDKV